MYSWREIFQLYVEAEVFESVSEASRGEWSVEESEQRLKLFAERVTRRGLGDGRHLKMKHSRAALETFLELNLFILNIKKVCHIMKFWALLLTEVLYSSSSLMQKRRARSSRNTPSALRCASLSRAPTLVLSPSPTTTSLSLRSCPNRT